MSDVCPDVMGRDLCGGGGLRREPRRVDVSSVSPGGSPGADGVLRVRDDAARTLSDRALALIDGPRQDDYASPEVNLSRIGAMWSAILGLEDAIPASKVALMMAALKIARAAHKPTEDSLVDTVGYVELAWRLR